MSPFCTLKHHFSIRANLWTETAQERETNYLMQFQIAGKYDAKVSFKTSMTACFQRLLGKEVASEGSPQTLWLFVGSMRLFDLSPEILLRFKELTNKICIWINTSLKSAFKRGQFNHFALLFPSELHCNKPLSLLGFLRSLVTGWK